MRYHFQIHEKGKRFLAECIELPGCHTQAESIAELNKNMQEALNLYIEQSMDSKELFPLPDESLMLSNPDNVVEVRLDPLIAFAFMVRYHQIKHGLTRQEAADEIGIENMYSTFRLFQQLRER